MAATRPPTRIVLVGMMGSGKTTVGREIARRTGWPWLDNDDLVRELTGREPSAIAIEDGEEALHDAEAASLGVALGREPPLVVAAAGSTVERADVRDRLRQAGHVVWLRARPGTLRTRIGSGVDRRPEAVDPEWLAARAAEREPLYREVADQVIDTDVRSAARVAAAILTAVGAGSVD